MSELKTYTVPLAHDKLTKDEVAARCIAAAEKKGYVPDPDPYFSYQQARTWDNAPASHFLAIKSAEYLFHNHDCQNEDRNTLTTLEAFEEYCGVTDEAKRETLEQRLADLEQKLDQLADIVAEKLQEPKVEAKTDVIKRASERVCRTEVALRLANIEDKIDRVAYTIAKKLQEPKEEAKTDDRIVIEGIFSFEAVDALMLPDGTQLYLSQKDKAWAKHNLFTDAESHTLVEVQQRTVGKFYLYEGRDPKKFDSYGLCLGEGEVSYPYMVNGFIGISNYHNSQITFQEVQPLNK